MGEVIKSIFRQREVEKLYEIKKYRKRAYGYCFLEVSMSIRENEDVISDKEIGRYNVEIPMLEIGDSFFLHDIQEVIVVKDRMRSSDGSITYYVKDKIVETENTKRTKKECDKIMQEFKELKEEFAEYKKKYKYEHRFFNFESAETI